MASWLLEQEVVLDQLLLLGRRHLEQGVVLARQVVLQTGQGVHQTALDLATLGSGDGWWQAQTTDTAASTDTAGTHVLLVQLSSDQL
jgi:hypothetical protein